MSDAIDFGMTQTEAHHSLMGWSQKQSITALYPDYHRLQIEHWISSRVEKLPETAFVVDIGQGDAPRQWIPMKCGYRTLGLLNEDVIGDITKLPLCTNSVDAIICAEVLEHCIDPRTACFEMHRALKPGGLLLVSSPFCWPDHHTDDYPDYWRFTRQGYESILEDFPEISIRPTKWTDEGFHLYELMRRFECFGMRHATEMVTGFMVEARKAFREGHA